MKKWHKMRLIFALLSSSVVFASSILAQGARDTLARPQESFSPSALTPEQLAQIPRVPTTRQRNASMVCSGQVAVSATGNGFGTGGADHLLNYPTTYTNEGNAWLPVGPMGGSMLYVPAGCGGLYYLAVEFEKDAWVSCNGQVGTQDDINVYFRLNGGPGPLGSGAGAWSGEGDGRRGTGAYGLVTRLRDFDQVTTWVHSDAGYHRCLSVYSVTMFRVGP